MFKSILTIILIVIIGYKSYSQATDPANPPKVIPLSPNAAEFAKYGNIPVSLSTGTPNISIPIYEINTGKIKVPISLSYHASGIQVNQKATWVGLGWSLNAGGVISRSIKGIPDEKTNGWMNSQNTTQTISNSTDYNVLSSYADNGNDSSPDFFSYNMPALSGRFIYSQTTSSFQTIPIEPLKITRLTASGGAVTDNTYQITDVDGTNYYYQTKQVYFNDSDIPVQNYTQSWYLSKIVSADTKDTVQFNYATSTNQGGINDETSETEIHTYTTGFDNSQYTNNGTAIKQTTFYHGYVALQEIIFRQGKVTFYANTPRRDYSGCMLDSITVFSKNYQGYHPIHKYQFNHDYFATSQPQANEFDYRLKLLSVVKLPLVPNGTSETHQFIYNTTPLPGINARNMDYWGFYNGTTFNNGYLPHILPGAPELYLFAQNNQYIGGADRNESDTYIQAGLLQKIIYPTGGYTVFNFEPHQYITDQTQTTSSLVSSGNLTGAGRRVIKTSNINFNWPNNALNNLGVFTVTLSPYTNPASLDDVPQRVTLTDLTTNTMLGTWVHDGNMPTTNTFTPNYIFDPTHSYQVKLAVNDDAPTSVKFSLTAQVTTTQTLTKKGGGLRIGNMQNFGSDNVLLSTQKYTYGGVNIGKNDNALANNYVKIMYHSTPGLPCAGGELVYYSIYYYGTSGYGGQNFEGANVLYGSVMQTNYDNNNKPNGKTEFAYNTNRAFASIYNPAIPGGREFIDNSGGITSLPTSEAYYAANADGSFTLLKSKVYSYGGPGFFQENLRQVYRNYINLPNGYYCGASVNEVFTRYDYKINIGATKLTSVVETDYDNTGAIITTTTDNSYDNPLHMQITKTKTTGSDGRQNVTDLSYPQDLVLTGTAETARQALINQHNIAAVLNEHKTINGAEVSTFKTNYLVYSNGLVMPYKYNVKIGSNTAEDRVVFDSYDNYGNLLQQRKADGPFTSYQWGYNKQYPVAEAKKAQSDEMMYYGFEEPGGWDALLSAYDTGFKHSGLASGRIDNTAATERYCLYNNWLNISLGSPKSYHYSGWVYSNGPTVDIYLFMKRAGETGYSSYVDHLFTDVRGKWVYVEKDFMVPADVKQLSLRIDNNGTANGGSQVWFDDLRLCPTDAQMTTYTFDPLVGMTSSMDSKGEPTYYEYDGFQRLISVKDKDGKIIRQTDYHYQGQ